MIENDFQETLTRGIVYYIMVKKVPLALLSMLTLNIMCCNAVLTSFATQGYFCDVNDPMRQNLLFQAFATEVSNLGYAKH